VGAELLRRYERRLFEGLSAPRNVFTWKSSSGNELDYLIVDRAKKILFPVEVKYQNSISDWDFQVAEKAFGRGLIVSKTAEVVREKAQAVGMSSFLFESDGVLPAG
jgi:predicted AAA+ superfamily ATPase